MNEVGRFEVRMRGGVFPGHRLRARCTYKPGSASLSRSSRRVPHQLIVQQQVAQVVVEENLDMAKALIHQVHTRKQSLEYEDGGWQQVAMDTLRAEWVPQVNDALKPLPFRVHPYLVHASNGQPKGQNKWDDTGYYHPRYGPGVNYEIEPHYRLVIGLWCNDAEPSRTRTATRVSNAVRLTQHSSSRRTIPSLPSFHTRTDSSSSSLPVSDEIRTSEVDLFIDNDDLFSSGASIDETATTVESTWSLDDDDDDDEQQVDGHEDRPLAVLVTVHSIQEEDNEDENSEEEEEEEEEGTKAGDLMQTQVDQVASLMDNPGTKMNQSTACATAKVAATPAETGCASAKTTVDLQDLSTNKNSDQQLCIKPQYLWQAPAMAQLDFCPTILPTCCMDKDDLESLQGTLATMDMTVATFENSCSVDLPFFASLESKITTGLNGILAKI